MECREVLLMKYVLKTLFIMLVILVLFVIFPNKFWAVPHSRCRFVKLIITSDPPFVKGDFYFTMLL